MAKKKRNPLDTAPWLVELDSETAQAYAVMREAEEEWLEAAQTAGCTLHHLPHDRRVVVLVPAAVALPDHAPLTSTRTEYVHHLRQLAAEQGKEATVGAKSTALPKWVGGEAIGAQRPKYEAARVRWRTQTAYRAGSLTAKQAIDYLRRRRDRQEEILTNAENQHRKDRLDRLKDRLLEADQAYIKALDFVQRNTSLKARVISGNALKISVYGKNEEGESVSKQASLPSIALVPAAPGCEFGEAPKRERAGLVTVLAQFGNLEFYK